MAVKVHSSLLAFTLIISASARAATWTDLWSTREQQAQHLLDSNQPAAAAGLFTDARRRAYAQLEAGQYAKAAKLLAPFKDTDSLYNRGNALAHAGQLRDALAAYNSALSQSPSNRDVIRNRDLVAHALEQQSQQPNSGGGSHSGGQQDQSNKGQSGQSSAGQSSGKQDSGGSSTQSQSGGQPQSGSPSQQGSSPSGNPASGNRPQSGAQSGSAEQARANTSTQPGNQAQSGTLSQANSHSQSPGQTSGSQPNDTRSPSAATQAQNAQPNSTQARNAQSSAAASTGQSSSSQALADKDAAAAMRYQQAQKSRGSPITNPATANLASGADFQEARARVDSQASPPRSEQALALDQWLRGIPDNSGELLRRKFLIEHLLRQQGNPQ